MALRGVQHLSFPLSLQAILTLKKKENRPKSEDRLRKREREGGGGGEIDPTMIKEFYLLNVTDNLFVLNYGTMAKLNNRISVTSRF